MYAIKIALCDDQEQYIDMLMKHVERYGNEVDTEFNITVYNSGRKLIDDIKTDSKMYDIVFLDVEMPEIDGLKTAKAIRKMSEDIILCFVTGHEQYTREAYQVEAPVSRRRYKEVRDRHLNRVKQQLEEKYCD